MATQEVRIYEGDATLVEVRSEDVPVEQANEATIGDRLDQALASLRAHVDRAKPSTAAAQASAAYDATVLLCRVAIGVIRVMRRRLDATD